MSLSVKLKLQMTCRLGSQFLKLKAAAIQPMGVSSERHGSLRQLKTCSLLWNVQGPKPALYHTAVLQSNPARRVPANEAQPQHHSHPKRQITLSNSCRPSPKVRFSIAGQLTSKGQRPQTPQAKNLTPKLKRRSPIQTEQGLGHEIELSAISLAAPSLQACPQLKAGSRVYGQRGWRRWRWLDYTYFRPSTGLSAQSLVLFSLAVIALQQDLCHRAYTKAAISTHETCINVEASRYYDFPFKQRQEPKQVHAQHPDRSSPTRNLGFYLSLSSPSQCPPRGI